MTDNKMFDENGGLITDQNFEGESRAFEDLTDDERDTYITTQRDESTKLDSIITRKSGKVQALNDALKDDDIELDENGAPKLDEHGKTIPKEVKNDKSAEAKVTNPDSQRMDRIELRQKGYAEEIIDEIMELGGMKVLDNKILKGSVDALQAEHDTQKATDIGDGPQGQTKTKYSKEDLAGMSVEEMEKVLPHAED